ncbi:MAG: HAD family phosphatase [Eubacteriales bacterium]|nr:HAD family phosphatase [Eubacteriales bacterium]
MIKAVVFDMDGVIFDSEKLYRKHWLLTAKEYGIPQDTMLELCDLIAGATKENNERLMKSRFGEDFDYMTFRSITLNRMDEEVMEYGVELKPGVKELFEFLKENGYKIGLATSTQQDRAERNLKRAGLYEYFDAIVYGSMVEKGKPFPDIYQKACEELSVQCSEAIGIEDSLNGVRSSATAGLYTIMVIDLVKPTPEIEKMANHIYHSLDEVRMLMKQM